MQPPFLHGSPVDISFVPWLVFDIVEAAAGFREGALFAIRGIIGELSKSGLVSLMVGSGALCVVWPKINGIIFLQR